MVMRRNTPLYTEELKEAKHKHQKIECLQKVELTVVHQLCISHRREVGRLQRQNRSMSEHSQMFVQDHKMRSWERREESLQAVLMTVILSWERLLK